MAGTAVQLVLVALARGCLSGLTQRTTPFIVALEGLDIKLKETSV